MARKPRWQLLGDRALEHIRRHPDIWVLSFRFVYGLRTVMPVAIGLSGYPPRRYLLLNGIGAAVWATALGLAAYHFGSFLEHMLGNVKKYELWVLGALVLIGALLWIRRPHQSGPHRPPGSPATPCSHACAQRRTALIADSN